MSEFEPVFLNADWTAADTGAGVSLPNFVVSSDYPLELRRRFDLDPIGEVCLRFFLHIDAAPAGTKVDINQWHVGSTQASAPFIADVTDYVTLEDNRLRLQVSQPGVFGSVWLDRIPCEETT